MYQGWNNCIAAVGLPFEIGKIYLANSSLTVNLYVFMFPAFMA